MDATGRAGQIEAISLSVGPLSKIPTPYGTWGCDDVSGLSVDGLDPGDHLWALSVGSEMVRQSHSHPIIGKDQHVGLSDMYWPGASAHGRVTVH